METIRTQAVRRRLMRGEILKLLSTGEPMLAQTLEYLLEYLGGNVHDDMLPCLNFLVDRGYIHAQNETGSIENPCPAPYMTVQISADGQEVVEGTRRDPSVLIPNAARGR